MSITFQLTLKWILRVVILLFDGSSYLVFVSEAIPSGGQWLLLTLCSRINADSAWMTLCSIGDQTPVSWMQFLYIFLAPVIISSWIITPSTLAPYLWKLVVQIYSSMLEQIVLSYILLPLRTCNFCLTVQVLNVWDTKLFREFLNDFSITPFKALFLVTPFSVSPCLPLLIHFPVYMS